MWTISHRLTAQRAGWYMINAGAKIQGGNTIGRRDLRIRLDGTKYIAGSTSPAPSESLTHYYGVHTQRFLTAGQYIELLFYQNSGDPLTLYGDSEQATYLAMIRVS